MKDRKYAGIIAIVFMAVITAFTIWGTDFLASLEKTTKEPMEIGETKGVKEAFKLVNSSGDVRGYEVVVKADGFYESMTLGVSFDEDGQTVTGFNVIKQNETPGLGDKITTPEFKAQVVKKAAPLYVGDMEPVGTKLEAITGATFSTKGVANGINIAYNFINGK